MGLATKEASACVLQTLKTFTRYPKNEPLVAAATVPWSSSPRIMPQGK